MKRIIFFCVFFVTVSALFAQEVDSIIDIRDGQVYRIVKIGEQWWMQENLNIGIQIDGNQDATDNGIMEKYCYDDNPDNCLVYGGLYLWDEMMDYNPSDDENPGITQGVCPIGWHLPTNSEWTELTDFLGGDIIAGGKMKEIGTVHWINPNSGATNESGFTGLPGGQLNYVDLFGYMGSHSYFWSSAESGRKFGWHLGLNAAGAGVSRSDYDEDFGFSVRCLWDFNQNSHLIITDTNFNLLANMIFYGDKTSEEIIIINSNVVDTIDISSIYTKSSAYSLNKSSSVLSPGDSIHVTITFQPPVKDIFLDTLYIQSDDPYRSLITVPINGTFPTEITFTDSTNVSCYGYSDGIATVTPSLGIPPYQYQWDDQGMQKDSTVTGLQANIYYHVTVTDSFGYSITDSIILYQPDQLKIDYYKTDTVCLNSSVGLISTNPTGGTPPYKYIWSNGDTTHVISDLQAGYYTVQVSDSNGCLDSESFTINSLVPYSDEKICIVTVDQISGKNLIVWEKTPNRGIANYNIYREGKLIGTIAFDELSIFLDTVADPESRPFLYYISVVDTCGNESELSSYHKPHFLQFVSSAGGVNLEWDGYEVEDGGINIESYTLFRGIDSLALSVLEEGIPTQITVYTDTDPNAREQKFYYRIAAILVNGCDPTGSMKSDINNYSYAMSNLVENSGESGVSIYHSDGLIIYPNPSSDVTIIEFPNPNHEQYQFLLTNLSGKVLRIIDNITEDKIEINRDGLQDGLYLIELRGSRIYRGKILIE